MKICRFISPSTNAPVFGALRGAEVFELSDQDLFAGEPQVSARAFALDAIRILPPIEPSKIVCVGRNYAEHARELGNEIPPEPLLFFKAPSSLVVSGELIVLPAQSAQVEHEGELAVVIGRTAKNISGDENALDYVFGYACLNDVTARDLQRRDGQFARAKSFDTFCPVLDFIETEFDPTNAEIRVRVNGEIKQRGNTAQMIFPVADLIRYISRQMTLLPGDLIATGTPAGVTALKPGDVCTVEIAGIGILSNLVVESQAI